MEHSLILALGMRAIRVLDDMGVTVSMEECEMLGSTEWFSSEEYCTGDGGYYVRVMDKVANYGSHVYHENYYTSSQMMHDYVVDRMKKYNERLDKILDMIAKEEFGEGSSKYRDFRYFCRVGSDIGYCHISFGVSKKEDDEYYDDYEDGYPEEDSYDRWEAYSELVEENLRGM